MLQKPSSGVLVHPLQQARQWVPVKASTYRTKLTGGKVTLRSHLIEASGSSEAWYEESKPPGGKGTIRAHLIEGRGSSEAWYVPPRAFARCGLATGKHASWRVRGGRVKRRPF